MDTGFYFCLRRDKISEICYTTTVINLFDEKFNYIQLNYPGKVWHITANSLFIDWFWRVSDKPLQSSDLPMITSQRKLTNHSCPYKYVGKNTYTKSIYKIKCCKNSCKNRGKNCIELSVNTSAVCAFLSEQVLIFRVITIKFNSSVVCRLLNH